MAEGLRLGGGEGLVTTDSGESLDSVFPLSHSVLFATLLLGTSPMQVFATSSSSSAAAQCSVGVRAACGWWSRTGGSSPVPPVGWLWECSSKRMRSLCWSRTGSGCSWGEGRQEGTGPHSRSTGEPELRHSSSASPVLPPEARKAKDGSNYSLIPPFFFFIFRFWSNKRAVTFEQWNTVFICPGGISQHHLSILNRSQW